MLEWFKNLKGKDMAAIITGAGGILLSIFLGYILLKILSNEFPHLETAIRETTQIQTTIQQQTNEVLRDITKVVEGNTRILQNLDTKISTLR